MIHIETHILKINQNEVEISRLNNHLQLLANSITKIRGYIYRIENKIKSLQDALEKGKFPTNWAKWIGIYWYNEKEIKNLFSGFGFDEKNVFYSKIEELRYEHEFRINIEKGKYWCSKWNAILETFLEKEKQLKEQLHKLLYENIKLKKEIADEEYSSGLKQLGISDNNDSERKEEKELINPSIIFQELRDPESGELQELCAKHATFLGLKIGETLHNPSILIIYDKIIKEEKVKTTLKSVGTTLRDKLNYCKRRS